MNHTIEQDHLKRHENVLHQLLDTFEIPAKRVRDAIDYALFPGGKRLRPTLVYLCGDLIGVTPAILDIIAAAVEFTHCYSLVHDDLPAMDNDDLRRGKPSCHRAFDEATAILVGDGMQALAIDILLSHLPRFLSSQQVIHATHELVKASGPSGMVSGQSLDLSELTDPSIDEQQLSYVHTLKTGKLIATCINMTLAASNATPSEKHALTLFAKHLGLVFQMQDDYLDKYGSLDVLGKNRASDEANQKTTFATLYSQTELADRIAQRFYEARQTLLGFKERAHPLLTFLQTLHERTQDISRR